MVNKQPGRLKQVGKFLGIIKDEPPPKVGSRAWWLDMAFYALFMMVSLYILDAIR